VLAHGIGEVRDLPVPRLVLLHGRHDVLVVSFIFGALWRRPQLEAHAGGRALPRGLSSFLLLRPVRIVLQTAAVLGFVLTLATALFGTTIELLNFAPTFVYVIFWLGLPLLSVIFGDVWRVLSP
jgi:hypothetical protein